MESVIPTKKRQRLSRERVLDAAIALARSDGLSGVSMPSVSRSLGTTPMSLYRHVENKDALVLGMLDRATSMVEVPAGRDEPTDEIIAVFEAIHGMLRRDPWTVQHFLQGYGGSEPVRTLVSRSLVALNRLGLERGDAWQAHQALLRYTYGEVLASEASTKESLQYDDADDAATKADETIREFEDAVSPEQSGMRYRETLQRYLRSVLGEVGSD
ncbi:TetR/AcrR family transcriptional regulator [Jannaschia sp. 2305UL9-9]|uniref:TetR/AcrR family transcriptional regulator n=1 Tax=Jannaschia sp. 2305UL9-9 TaxID=3121638 RepID=UPI00352852B3